MAEAVQTSDAGTTKLYVIDSPAARAAQRRQVLLVTVPVLVGTLALPAYVALVGLTLVDIVLFFVMWGLTMIGVGMGFHRHFTHGAFQTYRPIRLLLAILGSMAAQGPLLAWVVIHRRHHERADTEDDPHSPNPRGGGLWGRIRGAWHSHFGWLLDYCMPNPLHYGPDLIRDRQLNFVSRHYLKWVFAGVAIPAVVGGLSTWTWQGVLGGFLCGGLVRMFVVFNSFWVISWFCHMGGPRPNATDDHSTNSLILSLPTFGESWHNNHHAQPSSAAFGFRWWQLDPGYYIIRILELLGLAWNVKRPKTTRDPS